MKFVDVCGCVINLISPPLVVDRFQFYYPALSRTFRTGGGGEGHHVRTVLIIKKKAASALMPLLLPNHKTHTHRNSTPTCDLNLISNNQNAEIK